MTTIETCLASGTGSYTLNRYPPAGKGSLRAWDAADEYCLQYLDENALLSQGLRGRLLIVNDSFGGLSVPLHEYQPVVVSDSSVSARAVLSNAADNSLDPGAITLCNSLEPLQERFADGVDLVLIKIPGSIAMLEYQLCEIGKITSGDTHVIAAGMTRHIHNSTMSAFEKLVGETHSTLARKKARLIISKPDPVATRLHCQSVNYPVEYSLDIDSGGSGDGAEPVQAITLANHAGLFSLRRPDPASLLLLRYLPVESRFRTIVDLGCGNGIIGIIAAMLNKQARLVFSDDSYMAVESARMNFTRLYGGLREADFIHQDCLQQCPADDVDLVLCNPPFHQNSVVTDSIAWRMFKHARSALSNKGELWVIGNRHLAYHAKLKHLFGNCVTVASDNRFSLLKAVKTEAVKSRSDESDPAGS